MNDKERVLLGLALISGFIFTVSTLALFLESTLPKDMCEPWNWIPYLLIIISSLGIFIGGLVHYLTLEYLERKRRVDSIKAREEALINCLPSEEREIVKCLLDGPKFQSELSKMTRFNKVKTHRMLKRLEARGVVSLEKIGRTNIVRLVLK